MDGLKITGIARGGSAAFYLIGDPEAASAAAKRFGKGAWVCAVTSPDWNGCLSPWPAPKCFKDGEDFTGSADRFIDEMVKAIADFESENGFAPEKRFLCGYSLAGLCAVYALYRTGIFDGAASVSGSMWFDGWIDFIEASDRDIAGKCAYFSVGEKEKKTRNARLASVEDCTRRASEIMAGKGARTMFEFNPGNHFVEHDIRLAKGMKGLLRLIEMEIK